MKIKKSNRKNPGPSPEHKVVLGGAYSKSGDSGLTPPSSLLMHGTPKKRQTFDLPLFISALINQSAVLTF